ncbi:MAG: peptidoglycan DD-metalloendopeptidase family protein [Deltaproteobacteria bacterium]|nr:peptidoglycan DD-metalloendopeptidase family protein [Deltaproteobacteria bacterium]
MTHKTFGAAAIIGIAAVLFARAALAQYVFPIQGPKIVTATVGEYRIGHYHAGLDLGTEGREGLPVVAAAAGSVTRLRASANGYGKVIYMAHSGGVETVYAHLSEFVPALDAFAKRQQSPGRFAFSQTFGAGGPSFGAGDVIGYSGVTGTDVPHLHFELRKGGVPVNPLRHGITVPDTQPPLIEKLLIEPLAATAHGQGTFDRTIIPFDAGQIGGPVVIGGEVGLAVQVTDHIDGSPRDLAPWTIRFEIDGKPVYGVRYDRADYGDKAVSELDYHYELKETRTGVFHRLYRYAARTFAMTHAEEEGPPALAPGDHRARIVASDAAGNESTASFVFRVESPRSASPPCPPSPSAVEIPASATTFRERVLQFDLPGADPAAAIAISARLSEGGAIRELTATGARGRIAVDVPGPGELTIDARAGERAYRFASRVQWIRDGATIASPDATITVPKGAVFRESPVIAAAAPLPPAEGIRPSGRAQVFNQPWLPLRAPVRVQLSGDGGSLHLIDRGIWWYLDAGKATTHTHLGSFALAYDSAAPRIVSVAAEPLRGRSMIVAKCEDAGSGVSSAGARMWIDGAEVLAEPLPAMGQIRHIPEGRIAPGQHEVRVVVMDRSGQSASGRFTVTVP